MARWTANGLARSGTRSPVGRFVLRVMRDLGSVQLVDRGMTIAAHVFTSVLPILIVAGAVEANRGSERVLLFAEHLGFDEPTAEILQNSLPGRTQELHATGLIGVLLLVIAATSFARALERSIRTIWHTPNVSIKFAWRWFAAVATVVAGIGLIVTTRILLTGGGPAPVIEFLIEVALWSAVWWIASWIVVNRTVGLRQLAPGSVLAGVGFAVAGLVGRVVLPVLLGDSARRFGVLGLAFTYIGWLLVLACVLLVAVTVGRVVYLTYTGRAWRRSASRAMTTAVSSPDARSHGKGRMPRP